MPRVTLLAAGLMSGSGPTARRWSGVRRKRRRFRAPPRATVRAAARAAKEPVTGPKGPLSSASAGLSTASRMPATAPHALRGFGPRAPQRSRSKRREISARKKALRHVLGHGVQRSFWRVVDTLPRMQRDWMGHADRRPRHQVTCCHPCPCNACWRARRRALPPVPDSPQICCKVCNCVYPFAMWAKGSDGRRRCPNRSCEEWQWLEGAAKLEDDVGRDSR